LLIQKQTPEYSFFRHWNFKRDRTLWSDETKKSFLAANPPDGFSANRDKKHPMPPVKYCCAGGPGQLVQIYTVS